MKITGKTKRNPRTGRIEVAVDWINESTAPAPFFTEGGNWKTQGAIARQFPVVVDRSCEVPAGVPVFITRVVRVIRTKKGTPVFFVKVAVDEEKRERWEAQERRAAEKERRFKEFTEAVRLFYEKSGRNGEKEKALSALTALEAVMGDTISLRRGGYDLPAKRIREMLSGFNGPRYAGYIYTVISSYSRPTLAWRKLI